MKLSELITHTSQWLGVSRTIVESHARYLREAGLITSKGRGLAASEMSRGDKLLLLLSVCGVETAAHAAEGVRLWSAARRISPKKSKPHSFAFLEANSIEDMLSTLITADLGGGPLSVWLEEAASALATTIGTRGMPSHEITVDFYMNRYALKLVVSRNIQSIETQLKKLETDSIVVEFHFLSPPPENSKSTVQTDDAFRAQSQLIRRLDEKCLVGWGACLRDE